MLLNHFVILTREHPHDHWVDVRRMNILPALGWKHSRKNVLIVHGFNGTYSKSPMTILRDGKFKASFIFILIVNVNIVS